MFLCIAHLWKQGSTDLPNDIFPKQRVWDGSYMLKTVENNRQKIPERSSHGKFTTTQNDYSKNTFRNFSTEARFFKVLQICWDACSWDLLVEQLVLSHRSRMFDVIPSVRFQRQSCCRFWRTSSKASDARSDMKWMKWGNDPCKERRVALESALYTMLSQTTLFFFPSRILPYPGTLTTKKIKYLFTFTPSLMGDASSAKSHWLLETETPSTWWFGFNKASYKGYMLALEGYTYQDSYRKMTQNVGTFYHA